MLHSLAVVVMKVLYYCEEYYCNHGGRTHAREFFAALQNLHDVTHASIFPGAKNIAPKGDGIEKKRGKLRFLPTALQTFVRCFIPRSALVKELEKEIRAGKYDCLLIRASFQRNLMLGRLKKSLPDIVLVLEINSAYFDEKFHAIWLRKLWQWVEAGRYKRADRIIVVSSYLKDYLVGRGVPDEKICVNPNGVNPTLFDHQTSAKKTMLRRQLGIPDDAFVLGYVGGMEPFRRLNEVVERFAELRRQGNNTLYLLLVGDGEDMPRVTAAIDSHRAVLTGWIQCLGWQPYELIPQMISAFDVAIMPFTNPYCSPLKLFEYLAMGVPTMGPDTPAVREVVEDGTHLRLVNQDGSNFSDVVSELKNSPHIRRRLAMEGQRWVLENHTWEKNAERVMEHVRSARNSV